MKKIFLLLLIISCTKHQSTTEKSEWFSYDFETSLTTPKEIKIDEGNIESYYRGAYAEMISLNLEQKRDISFEWKNRGVTYTLTVYLSGGKSNERRTDPQPPPPPPPPKFRR